MNQIITSLLDTDLYTLTVGQTAYHNYPKANVAYEFTCRNEGVQLGFLAEEVQREISLMSENVRGLTSKEVDYVSENLDFLKDNYIQFLAHYQFNPDEVKVQNVNGDLKIRIEGLWYRTVFWEVPLLAIVNELYFRGLNKGGGAWEQGKINLANHVEMIKPYPQFRFAEFGTRRRFSKAWQDYEVGYLKEKVGKQLVGVSNVWLAMKHKLKAIGTVSHQYFSAHLALVDDIALAQKRALHVWLSEFDNMLGIALTDTFTTKAFFNDFGNVLSNAFDGLRHDSGCPYEFAENSIQHYVKMGIDPKTKTLVFSDGLDFPRAIDIWKEFVGQIGVSFGIGTWLSNNMGLKPLNIVIKLIECNGEHVVKLSDVSGKNMGNAEKIIEVKHAYNVPAVGIEDKYHTCAHADSIAIGKPFLVEDVSGKGC